MLFGMLTLLYFCLIFLQLTNSSFFLKRKLIVKRSDSTHQQRMSIKRSSEEVKQNGRKKVKPMLKHSYTYAGKRYLASGANYHDHGDVEDPDIDYKIKYEELMKKVSIITFDVIWTQM